MEPQLRRGRFESDDAFNICRGVQVTISPDGEWIMQHFSNSSANTRPEFTHCFYRKALISTRKGDKAFVMNTKLRSIVSAQWSPDSKRLAFGGSDRVYFYTTEGKFNTKFRVPDGSVCRVWWDDDTCLKVATQSGNLYECTVDKKNWIKETFCSTNAIRRHTKDDRVVFGNHFVTIAHVDKKTRELRVRIQSNFLAFNFKSIVITHLNDVAVSRNGDFVALATSEGMAVCGVGETSVTLYDEFLNCALCAVSPDGKSFVFVCKDNMLVAISDGSIRHCSTVMNVSELYFTDNKTYVAVLHNTQSHRVNLVRRTFT